VTWRAAPAKCARPEAMAGRFRCDAGLMRAAVVTWDGGSNREPFEVLCRGLVGRGAQLHVLSHEIHRGLYEGLGASFDALPVGEKTMGARPSADQERERVLRVWLSQAIADAVVDLLTQAPFDVAIVDAAMLSAFAGCEAVGTPFIVVHHSLPGAAWLGPRRRQFDALVGPLNDVRRSLQLPALASFPECMARATAHIVPTAACLDAPVPWELRLDYVGPLQPQQPDGDLPGLPARFVLVAFSTTWQRQVDHLQKAIDALAALERDVVVTTGPSVDPAELQTSDNVVVFAELPHQRILDRADAVVTHAGHGTVISALTAGVPLVCIPMGRDQHDVTRQVVAAGVGLEVDVDNILGDLLPAVRHVLGDPSVAAAAARIRRSIAEHGGVEEALAIITRCVRERSHAQTT
jgi:UDP:flavonoid glycosyltransferase YjiC (YdhE family)